MPATYPTLNQSAATRSVCLLCVTFQHMRKMVSSIVSVSNTTQTYQRMCMCVAFDRIIQLVFFSLFHWIRAEEKIAIRACRLMFMCVHSRMEWNIITNVAWARMGNGIGGREEETEQNFLCTIIAPYLWSMLCIVHTQTHTHTRVHSPIKY